jgi:hypothetical protein
MKMKDEWKRFRNWKVAGGVGTVAALGIAGIALAAPGDVPDVPTPITLQSQVGTSESLSPSTTWRFTLTTDETRSLDLGATLPVTTTAQKASSASPSTTHRMMLAPGDDDMDYSFGDSSPDTPDRSYDSSPDSPDISVDSSVDSVDSSIDSVDSSVDS